MKLTLFMFLILVGTFHDQQDTTRLSAKEPDRSSTRTGSVSGKIELAKTLNTGPSPHAMAHTHPYGIPVMSAHSLPVTNEYANVVVYLEAGKKMREPLQETAHAKIDQRNAEFFPHVLPIRVGTVVDFVNRDNVYHNVFSLSPAKKFNIGRRPTGKAVPVVFDKPGVVEIFCDIHSNMAAFVLVLENDYFTLPDNDGNYIIEHVPPGVYTIKAWHEHLVCNEQTITIVPDSTSNVNFMME